MKYSWLLLVLVAINVIVNAFFSNKLNKIQLTQFDNLSKINRGYYYLLHVLSDIRYSKDIRLFGARKMMIDRSDGYNQAQSEITKKKAMESQKYVFGSKGNMAITTIMTYLVLAVMAIKNQITIGEFMMLTTSGSTIVASINVLLKQILDLRRFAQYAEKYVQFQKDNRYEEKGSLQCHDLTNIELEFKYVSFKYPNQDQYALKDINVKISTGEHWSIVGLNGAGKTTFIKLICR